MSSLQTQRARTLRHKSTPAEETLWQHLRNRQLGAKFRRQHPLPPFYADFFCAEHLLVIELDGSSHLGREGYDLWRTQQLEQRGCKVLRFQNWEVHRNLEGVLEQIRQEIAGKPEQ
ncbi:endonuclease domain-containing protein [Deinococcus misasensis]|uniref:endonuclease domain-containing protein n=1 Tax=Deinococcus misasensis TaxID=392413 RepID=UPI00055687D9|nr:endonuclease domain-containing protein [Deinococcus misasensis]